MPMGESPPLKYGHEPGRWVACDYAVCPAILNEFLDKLEVVPERDAFANKDNKRFDKWYGEGSSDGEDAFQKNWGSEILWINPPFNIFPRVLDKIVQEKAHAVILVPKWTKHKFFWKSGVSRWTRSWSPRVQSCLRGMEKSKKWRSGTFMHFWSAGMYPTCLPCEVRGIPTPSLPLIEE